MGGRAAWRAVPPHVAVFAQTCGSRRAAGVGGHATREAAASYELQLAGVAPARPRARASNNS